MAYQTDLNKLFLPLKSAELTNVITADTIYNVSFNPLLYIFYTSINLVSYAFEESNHFKSSNNGTKKNKKQNIT